MIGSTLRTITTQFIFNSLLQHTLFNRLEGYSTGNDFCFFGTPKSEESARTRFAAGTTCSCKKEKTVSQKAMRVPRKFFIAVYQCLKCKESLFLWVQPSCSIVFVFAMNVESESGNQDKSCDTDRYKNFFPSWCYPSECEYRGMKIWAGL